jgi:hypothetical protein
MSGLVGGGFSNKLNLRWEIARKDESRVIDR